MIAKFEKRNLLQYGHISAHKYENLRNLPHWHMEYELVFCDSGSAKITVGNESYVLKKGHCLFIGSGEVHSIQSLTESVISVIKIEPRFIDNIFEEKTPASPLIKTNLSLEDVFDELYNENQKNHTFSTVICDSIILKTLAFLFKNCDMRKKQKTGGSEKYKALLKLIEERYADITFEDAADFMCYSKPYFSRYFARITGMSFSSYLNIIRVAEAVSLIEEGRLSITEIAHASGFGTIRHFNRIFKEITGFSPKNLPENFVLIQYRKSVSSEEFDPTLSSAAIM